MRAEMHPWIDGAEFKVNAGAGFCPVVVTVTSRGSTFLLYLERVQAEELADSIDEFLVENKEVKTER